MLVKVSVKYPETDVFHEEVFMSLFCFTDDGYLCCWNCNEMFACLYKQNSYFLKNFIMICGFHKRFSVVS